MSELDGQIHITICKTSQFNYTASETLGYNGSTLYWNGITNDSSILTWTGLDDTLKFAEAFLFLYTGSKSVSMQVNQTIERNKGVKEEDIQLDDKISLPFGHCKLYEGKPWRNFYFKFEGGEVGEFIVFISDSSAALSYQAKLSCIIFGLYCIIKCFHLIIKH